MNKLQRLLPLWRSKLRYLIILPVVALVVTSVFGYMIIAKGQTQYGEELQNRIWQTIIDKGMNDARNTSASFSYTDSGKYEFKPSKFADTLDLPADELEEMDELYSFTVSKLNFGIKTSGYTDLTNIYVPKTDSHAEAWFSNNKKKYSAAVDLKLKETEAFIKYDYSKDAKALVSNLFGGSSYADPNKNKWLQITDQWELNDLRESMAQFLKPEQNPAYEQLLKNNRLFDIKNLKGAKKIDGKAAVQYELALNKTRLRNLISQGLDLSMNGMEQADKDFAKDIMFALVEKIQVKEFNVWIGVTDGKLYKSTLTSNALSVSKTFSELEKNFNNPNSSIGKEVKENLEQARAKSRDAKRVADARQIASALELYFNDHNQYPPAQNGQPVGLTPDYIGNMPTEPTPADGTCTDYDNIYWYYRPTPTHYRFLLCLGADTGGIKGGVAEMTEWGFTHTAPVDNVYDEDLELDRIKTAILDAIKNMNFSAKLNMEYSATKIGQTQEIKPPKKYIRAATNLYNGFTAAFSAATSPFKFDK